MSGKHLVRSMTDPNDQVQTPRRSRLDRAPLFLEGAMSMVLMGAQYKRDADRAPVGHEQVAKPRPGDFG
jgi:hypothetical protein